MTSPGSRPSRLLVVAAAGYGKTTVLETERPPGGVLCTAVEALAHGVPEASWIGIDALDGVDVEGQRELLRRLDALPADTGFCLATRTPLDPAVRVGLRGQVFERGPADLALEPFAVARLLAERVRRHRPRGGAPRVSTSPGAGPPWSTSPATLSRGSPTSTSPAP